MTPTIQAWTHAALAATAIVAVVVLACVANLSVDEAATVIVAASGIGGTGVAAAVAANRPAVVTRQPVQAQP